MNTSATRQQHPVLGEIAVLQREGPLGLLTATIAPEYGRITGLTLSRGEEHLEIFHPDPEGIKQRTFAGVFRMAPAAGRVMRLVQRSDGGHDSIPREYVFDGVTRSFDNVRIPEGPAALVHGLVRDAVWRFASGGIDNGSPYFEMQVNHSQMSPYWECFPFEALIVQRHILTENGLEVQLAIYSTGDVPMPANDGLHSRISCLSGPETRVIMPAHQIVEVDQDLIPTGRRHSVESPMYSWFNMQRPGRTVASFDNISVVDHFFTLLDRHEPCRVQFPTKGFEVLIHDAAAQFAVIFMPDDRSFVTIEPLDKLPGGMYGDPDHGDPRSWGGTSHVIQPGGELLSTTTFTLAPLG